MYEREDIQRALHLIRWLHGMIWNDTYLEYLVGGKHNIDININIELTITSRSKW